MFINLNEHFKVNPPKYIELETLLSNLHPQTMFCCLLYPRREAGILWIHHRRRPRPRPRPQRFLVSDLQSTFLSGFLSYLAGGLIW